MPLAPRELRESWADINVPPQDHGCIRCGATENDETEYIEGLPVVPRLTPVTWRCAGCNRLVCRACTLTLPGWRRPTEPHGKSSHSNEPGPGGREYYHDTLCSKECWERVGRPEE